MSRSRSDGIRSRACRPRFAAQADQDVLGRLVGVDQAALVAQGDGRHRLAVQLADEDRALERRLAGEVGEAARIGASASVAMRMT